VSVILKLPAKCAQTSRQRQSGGVGTSPSVSAFTYPSIADGTLSTQQKALFSCKGDTLRLVVASKCEGCQVTYSTVAGFFESRKRSERQQVGITSLVKALFSSGR